jgi:hypothetical protein
MPVAPLRQIEGDFGAESDAARDLREREGRGHSTNLVGLPTELIASRCFNEHPMPLRLSGVREMNCRSRWRSPHGQAGNST